MKRRMDDIYDGLCDECRGRKTKETIGDLLKTLDKDRLVDSEERIAKTVADIRENAEKSDREGMIEVHRSTVGRVLRFFKDQVKQYDNPTNDPQRFGVIAAIAIELVVDDSEDSTRIAADLIDEVFCHITYKYARIAKTKVRKSK